MFTKGKKKDGKVTFGWYKSKPRYLRAIQWSCSLGLFIPDIYIKDGKYYLRTFVESIELKEGDYIIVNNGYKVIPRCYMESMYEKCFTHG